MKWVSGYSTAEVVRRCAVTAREVQWWCEAGLLRPAMRGHARAFAQSDLRLVALIRDLREKEIKIPRIRRLLPRLPEQAGYLVIHEPGRIQFCPTEEKVLEVCTAARHGVQVVGLAAGGQS